MHNNISCVLEPVQTDVTANHKPKHNNISCVLEPVPSMNLCITTLAVSWNQSRQMSQQIINLNIATLAVSWNLEASPHMNVNIHNNISCVMEPVHTDVTANHEPERNPKMRQKY